MNEQKKTYVKPAIEGVYLLPDEVVLAFCKTLTGGGPGADGTACSLVETCVNDGT